MTRYEEWTDPVPDARSIDRGEQVADHILDTIFVRRCDTTLYSQQKIINSNKIQLFNRIINNNN
jgi:hypothetical protein